MKKLICFFCIFFIVVFVTFVSFAGELNIINNMSGIKDASSINTGGIGNALNIVIAFLQVSGLGIAIIVVTLLGVKYMLGSVGEKVEIKKQATPIVIGCAILFGAVGILRIVESVATKALK